MLPLFATLVMFNNNNQRQSFSFSLTRVAIFAALYCCCSSLLLTNNNNMFVSCQQDDDDESGFDDSGYDQQPVQNHDAEGSNHSPSGYQQSNANAEDADDDDDIDESRVSSVQVLPSGAQLVGNSLTPQTGDSSPASYIPPLAMYESAPYKSSAVQPTIDLEGAEHRDESAPLIRKKRYAKKHAYIGPVYTYVKTDKHANFKWGVKHKVGKKYGGK